MALQRAGIEAVVHEAYDTTADGVGGLLSTAPNGLRALESIGADRAVREAGVPLTGMVTCSGTGKVLGEFGSEPPMPLVWRSELYRALHDEATRRDVRVVRGKWAPRSGCRCRPRRSPPPSGCAGHGWSGSSPRPRAPTATRPRARSLRDPLMPRAMKFSTPDRFTWQFAHRIDRDSPVTA